MKCQSEQILVYLVCTSVGRVYVFEHVAGYTWDSHIGELQLAGLLVSLLLVPRKVIG